MTLSKGGKPSAGQSAIEKARQIIENARVAIEKKQEGYACYTVVKDSGVDKKSKSTHHFLTVSAPDRSPFQAIVPAHFLNKKGKLSISEMGSPGSTVIVSNRRVSRDKEVYEHGCMTVRSCIDTDYVVEAVI